MSLEEAIRLAVDQDVEQLIHLQEREELEEVYGIPVIVSVFFVSSFGFCLHIPTCGRCCAHRSCFGSALADPVWVRVSVPSVLSPSTA